jgi:hypothetical protein
MFRNCSVCESPTEVLKSVNESLVRRVKLRDIAKMCGLSKSAIGRHKLKCVPREILRNYKNAKFNAQRGRVFVKWPHDECVPPEDRGKITPSHLEMTADDVLIVVCYETKLFDELGRYVNALQAYVPAHEENARRDRDAKSPPAVT